MRALIIEKLYDWSKIPYQKWFKNNVPWPVNEESLLGYATDSLGFHLGLFLQRNHFEIQAKLEDHDVFHVLTHTGVTVPEEVGMQFYLLGNGKRSIYQFMVILLGGILYPDKGIYFRKQYRRGKSAHPFHRLDFLKLLEQPLVSLQRTFNIQ
ncbi:hypothetical protein [Flavobacterium sp. '19STA2R22 D10 B1']|uniref:hypothetical protein n=1 Tax=Flavobacterium aerium TaxID=3037261 RepID=UPI00278BF011|nr:hypothetical protein [Flavobacterium sp. '19STA2R22 D10 B1']